MRIHYLFLLITCISMQSSELFALGKNKQPTGFTPCMCYCSDVCGLRKSRPDDKPFIDEGTGLCFCQQRDKDNYLKNHCNVIPAPDPSIPTCCVPQSEPLLEKTEKKTRRGRTTAVKKPVYRATRRRIIHQQPVQPVYETTTRDVMYQY